MLSVKLEVKQTLLSKFLFQLALFLNFYKIIDNKLMWQIIDMSLLDIKAFKYRYKCGKTKSKWTCYKVQKN